MTAILKPSLDAKHFAAHLQRKAMRSILALSIGLLLAGRAAMGGKVLIPGQSTVSDVEAKWGPAAMSLTPRASGPDERLTT